MRNAGGCGGDSIQVLPPQNEPIARIHHPPGIAANIQRELAINISLSVLQVTRSSLCILTLPHKQAEGARVWLILRP